MASLFVWLLIVAKCKEMHLILIVQTNFTTAPNLGGKLLLKQYVFIMKGKQWNQGLFKTLSHFGASDNWAHSIIKSL